MWPRLNRIDTQGQLGPSPTTNRRLGRSVASRHRNGLATTGNAYSQSQTSDRGFPERVVTPGRLCSKVQTNRVRCTCNWPRRSQPTVRRKTAAVRRRQPAGLATTGRHVQTSDRASTSRHSSPLHATQGIPTPHMARLPVISREPAQLNHSNVQIWSPACRL